MNRSVLQFFILLFIVGGLIVGCGPQKSIQELNPGVSFMGKSDVLKFLTGAQTESDKAIVTYKEDGKASVYVKRMGKDLSAKWKVEEDGMIIIKTKHRTNKWYIATDEKTSYGLSGKIVEFKKL